MSKNQCAISCFIAFIRINVKALREDLQDKWKHTLLSCYYSPAIHVQPLCVYICYNIPESNQIQHHSHAFLQTIKHMRFL